MEKKTNKKVLAKKPLVKKVPVKKTTSSSTLSLMSDFSQALVITSVIILLTISFMVVGMQKKISLLESEQNKNYFGVLDEVKIVKKAKASFGNLAINYSSDANGVKEMSSALGMGGREVTQVSSNDTIAGSENITSQPSYDIDAKMIAPMDIVKYNYIYVGEDFSLLPSEVDVYKKITPDLSKEFSNLFSGKKISFFDLKKFSDISINNLTINEDRDYGYSIYLGLQDGNFSIYKNWKKWPNLDSLCASTGYEVSCYEQNRLTIADILPDQEILNISNKFLADYDINLDNYAEGVIQKSWLRYYIASDSEQSIYIPESISVIYPLKINDVMVYEEYGNFSGLTVEVDMKERKVSGLNGLSYQYYESSLYNTETDREAIMKIVNQGGRYPDYFYYEGSDFKSIDIEVGTPTLGLVKIWNYDNNYSNGYELFVPAYIFPIVSESEASYFNKENIVVPAVKDFF
ncbi:MAG TPA: hypothetical protein PK142_03190, partial [bacterium]|nr:hypothetical protein [bacterium]